LRARISLTAPVRNGAPPHAYITVPKTGETQPTHAASGSEYPTTIQNINPGIFTPITQNMLGMATRKTRLIRRAVQN
ncbi:hypothetical protein, partial [Klebsiella variicola]|uniref:hypothetical protein n=1 Tax=Klebsiella variicola TaxID=244366 RepID=UPI0039C2C102